MWTCECARLLLTAVSRLKRPNEGSGRTTRPPRSGQQLACYANRRGRRWRVPTASAASWTCSKRGKCWKYVPRWCGIQSRRWLFFPPHFLCVAAGWWFFFHWRSWLCCGRQARVQVPGEEIQLWRVLHADDRGRWLHAVGESQGQRVHHQRAWVPLMHCDNRTFALIRLCRLVTSSPPRVCVCVCGLLFPGRGPTPHSAVCSPWCTDSGWCSLCCGAFFRWSWPQLWLPAKVQLVTVGCDACCHSVPFYYY